MSFWTIFSRGQRRANQTQSVLRRSCPVRSEVQSVTWKSFGTLILIDEPNFYPRITLNRSRVVMRTSSKPQIDLKSSTRNLNLSRSDYHSQLHIDNNKLSKINLWFQQAASYLIEYLKMETNTARLSSIKVKIRKALTNIQIRHYPRYQYHYLYFREFCLVSGTI